MDEGKNDQADSGKAQKWNGNEHGADFISEPRSGRHAKGRPLRYGNLKPAGVYAVGQRLWRRSLPSFIERQRPAG